VTACPSGIIAPGSPDQPEILHASAVAAPSGVVAFCARSGTGKSTLAARLRHRGYGEWADDAVVWAPAEAGAVTLPVRARREGCEREGGVEQLAYRALPLTAIVILERIDHASEGQDLAAHRVSGAAALTAVLPHAHPCPHDDQHRRRDFLLRYVHLAATTPVVLLRFRHDARKIETLCDTVMHILDSVDAGAFAVR
jgi:hypothetical protein